MKESLTSRVGRIVSGSLNALIEAVENAAPETVMEEAIREIDSAIEEVRAELGRTLANKHLASQRLMEENRKHEQLSAKIELAVGAQRDDLAEAAIASQLDIEAQIPVLEARVSECSVTEKELEGYIQALQAKQREMREELRQFRESRREAVSVSAAHPAGSGVGGGVQARVEKAGSAFDRVLEKSAGLPGSRGSADRKSAAQLAELEELARKNRIQERLAAIKRQGESSD